MLEEKLEAIIERIKKHRSFYEQNEMGVRDQIVNPVLKNLGWDTENPDEVQPNVSMEEGIPDYSLIKGNKVLFIEAKNLSVDVEQRNIISQLAKYCFGKGTMYGVLTNGAIWILFRSFQEDTTMPERIVWKVDIENDGLKASIRRLNTISKENVDDIENLIKKLQILDEIWFSLVEEPEEIVKELVPVFEKLVKEGYPDYHFETFEIKDFLEERIKELVTSSEEPKVEPSQEISISEEGRPRKMKINDVTWEIRYSFEILTNSAEWLIKKGKLKSSDCPIPAGHRSKRNLVNTEPKHRYGESFTSAKRLSNGLFIEAHYSTANLIKNAKRLLEKFGYQRDMLSIEYR